MSGEPTEHPSGDGAADDGSGDEPAGDGDGNDRTAGGAGRELARVGPRPTPARPPRRTGVFLDPDDLREYVGGLLRVVLGGYEVDAHGNFTFTHDGARVFVTVGPTPIGPTVGVFSVTTLDVELTAGLSRFLLTSNHRLGFGSFSYDPDNGAVWLRHTLLGTTLDGPELQAAVMAVASAAAHFTDEITERFGGRPFDDAPRDVREATVPPEADPQQGPPGGASGYL